VRRRALLAAAAALPLVRANAVEYAVVTPRPLVFPRDHGAHPDYRTEWWYLTGWLEDPQGGPLGFQVTFFRSRPPRESANPSAFSPRQLIFAHAALADPALGRLRHAERSARAGLGLAGAEAGNTRVWIDDWRLSLDADGRYRTRVAAEGWGLELELAPTQPLLLQGQEGYSRKGPGAQEASHYYSRPQLRVSGTLRRDGRAVRVGGSAWLDHEWSTTILNPAAAGWDWVGINLNDGGALMAFRIRDNKTGGSLWAGGTRRDAAGGVRVFSPAEVSWRPLRQWRSPRTGVVYPVA
jgi:predicted secreted hydrolase